MKNRIIQIVILAIMMMSFNNLFAQQNETTNTEKSIVLFVEFQFDADDMDRAIELLTEMQNQTIENEQGCIAYDMLLNEEKPNTIYLYECYENKAALDLHNSASYFKSIVNEKLSLLIKESNILNLTPINDIEIMM